MRFSIAASRTQTACPVVDLFLCDEAPQFNCLTAALALCWLHEYRPYKKLTPRLPSQCHILDTFCAGFWKLYRDLLADRDPRDAQRDEKQASRKRERMSPRPDSRSKGGEEKRDAHEKEHRSSTAKSMIQRDKVTKN